MAMYEGSILSLSEEQFNDLLDNLRWDVNSGMELDVRPVLPIRSDFKDKLFRFANVAVEYYNQENRSNQFEILDPLHYTPAGTEQYHLGFIARSKEDSSLLKLFFAEVSSSDDKVMATKCIIVEPGNPLFAIGCDSCHPDGVIYHPFHYGDPLDDWPPLHFSSRQSYAKRLLSEAYIITSFEQNLNAEDVDELKVATCRYVYDALYLYNANHGTSFKPLGTVASVRFGCSNPYINGEAVWVHFVFKAINKDPYLIDASPTYFFAEYGLLAEATTTCVMMGHTYPSSAYPGTETKCAVCRVHCPTMLVHPEDYRAGRYGGNLADVLDKGRSRTVKAKLEQKDGHSSDVARLEYLKALEK